MNIINNCSCYVNLASENLNVANFCTSVILFASLFDRNICLFTIWLGSFTNYIDEFFNILLSLETFSALQVDKNRHGLTSNFNSVFLTEGIFKTGA